MSTHPVLPESQALDSHNPCFARVLVVMTKDASQRRRWPLVIVALLFCSVAAFALWRPDRQPGVAQQNAIARLKKAGAILELDPYGNVVSVRVLPEGDLTALDHLQDLPRLKALYLQLTPIDDDDLSHLAGRDSLEHLFLSGTAISDEGLKHLAGLTRLKSLYLTGTSIDGSGLRALSGATVLEDLNVADTRCTDEALAHLSGLTHLRVLDVSGTPVSDAGLEHLVNLKELTLLGVVGAQVTTEGADKLKQSLPALNVRFQF